jgi:hypothetical protein
MTDIVSAVVNCLPHVAIWGNTNARMSCRGQSIPAGIFPLLVFLKNGILGALLKNYYDIKRKLQLYG